MKWYAVKKEYIDYLKKWDKKIPNVDYGNRMKCFIGVIFIKNDIEYFAPLTSFKEKFISMKNDIDFSGSYSDDVRIRGTFTGTLDGDGHTLKNLQEIQYGSVFETISKGTIENLTVEGLKLSSNHQSATLRTGFAGTMKDSASMDHVFVV